MTNCQTCKLRDRCPIAFGEACELNDREREITPPFAGMPRPYKVPQGVD